MNSAKSERSFTIALALSAVAHSAVLGVQLVRLHRLPPIDKKTPLAIIYEREPEQTVDRLKEQFAELADTMKELPGVDAPESQIRMPSRPLGGLPGAGIGGGGGLSTGSGMPEGFGAGAAGAAPGNRSQAALSAVIDLTNLVEAAQGNPVLLSYFSAIREQIQRAANRNTWMAGQGVEGLVYVSFVMSKAGEVQSVSLVSDRSAPSKHLQDIALQIVKAAGPFPAFPPSIPDPVKTIVVPLEFLLGSS